MKLLGEDIGQYDDDGYDWVCVFRDWMADPCWDIFERSEKYRDVLEKFQEIYDRAGCTNITQVEYIYALEKRLDDMDKVITSLCNCHP